MSKGIEIKDASNREKIKIILSLGLPAMIENLLQTIVGFVDTLFVSKLGLNEVTAVGVTNAILAVYLAVFLAMGIGTSSLIAKSVGAGDLDKAKAIARQSSFISAILGIIFGVITFSLPNLYCRSWVPSRMCWPVELFTSASSLFLPFSYPL